MSSDDYRVHNIYKYTRKSFKKNKRPPGNDDITIRETTCMDPPDSAVRGEAVSCVPGNCTFDANAEDEIANILNKKCPVINLAQQQLQNLLEETDRLLCCGNQGCCRNLQDLLRCFKYFLSLDRCRCVLLIFIVVSFFLGVLFGAASCGNYHGRFNSPILQCVDHYFIPNMYPRIEDTFRSIV